ncbi:MAG TPA: SDR family NAD(P)-dependent oxidoreductase [Verrucomicrobiae bacterium]|nr:SDR family NAD(P)-dependent oxidoreductase [Verrucomicrobiae bacterium]
MTDATVSAPRVALVTGANRGIGVAICRQLVDRGLTVVVAARDPEQAERAAQQLAADRAIPAALDVTDEESVRRCHQLVTTRCGAVDILVNNAGVLLDDERAILDVSEAILEATLAVNLVGAWRMVRQFVPAMVERGYGRVVTLSSSLGSFSPVETGSPAYSVSKVAVNMLTAQLAAELAGTGVLVNCVDPGWVRTDMGGPDAPRTPAQGADTVTFLATLGDDGPTGRCFRDRMPISW